MEGIALYNIGIELCVIALGVRECLIYKIVMCARLIKGVGGEEKERSSSANCIMVRIQEKKCTTKQDKRKT